MVHHVCGLATSTGTQRRAQRLQECLAFYMPTMPVATFR